MWQQGVLMIALIWAQVRYRVGRTLALLAGIAVATASFAGPAKVADLAAADRGRRAAFRAGRLRHPGPAARLGVGDRAAGRPVPAKLPLQGIAGGISLAQRSAVRSVPGVGVAAPIAMVGYAMPVISIPVDLTRLLGARTRAVFRIAVTDLTDAGLSRVPEASYVVYVTRDQMTEPSIDSPTTKGARDFGQEQLPGGPKVEVCADRGYDPLRHGSARQRGEPRLCDVRGRHAGLGFLQVSGISELSGGRLGIDVQIPYPILIAAIDPAAEARLDGLNRAVVSGRYLPELPNGVSAPRIGGTAPGGQPPGHYPVLVSVAAVYRSQPGRIDLRAGQPAPRAAHRRDLAASSGGTARWPRGRPGPVHCQPGLPPVPWRSEPSHPVH